MGLSVFVRRRLSLSVGGPRGLVGKDKASFSSLGKLACCLLPSAHTDISPLSLLGGPIKREEETLSSFHYTSLFFLGHHDQRRRAKNKKH